MKDKCCDAPKKMKPTIHLDSKDFPLLKGATIGKEFNLKVKAKVVSISQNVMDGKTNLSGSLEIQDINDSEKSAFDKNWDKFGDE